MTRTTSILSLVLAMLVALVATVPASATDGYRSADSVLANGTAQTTTVSSDTDAKPLFAGTTDDPSSSGVSAGAYRSADSVLAVGGSPQPSSVKASGQGYVDALLRSSGASQPKPVAVVGTKAGDGFHWGDALIGALIASVVMLAILAAARSVARHRRATAESRA